MQVCDNGGMTDLRYLSFSSYCRQKYGHRIFRIPLDAGMTCPNRDGRIGYGGCIFCAGGSGDFAYRYTGVLPDPEDIPYTHARRDPKDEYIAYFQAYTNTYAPAERLRELFEPVMKDERFAGIAIATRPDCLGEDVLALLKDLRMSYPDKILWVELGLQTISEKNAVWMRRGYPLAVFDQAVAHLHELGIDVTVHLIIGLPGEDEIQVGKTIDHLNALHVEGVKLQLLQIIEGTDLAELWKRGEISEMSEDEYVRIIGMCIARLDPHTVIHRLTGDGNAKTLLAPLWSLRKREVLNHIERYLRENDIVQGKEYTNYG